MLFLVSVARTQQFSMGGLWAWSHTDIFKSSPGLIKFFFCYLWWCCAAVRKKRTHTKKYTFLRSIILLCYVWPHFDYSQLRRDAEPVGGLSSISQCRCELCQNENNPSGAYKFHGEKKDDNIIPFVIIPFHHNDNPFCCLS